MDYKVEIRIDTACTIVVVDGGLLTHLLATSSAIREYIVRLVTQEQ